MSFYDIICRQCLKYSQTFVCQNEDLMSVSCFDIWTMLKKQKRVSSPLGASKVEKASLVGSIRGNNGIQTRVARSVLPQEKALLHLVNIT
ncbi:hypothetical protein Anas_14167 [Armadillidium nasatum]|uniref:Uncharacterized protein n=1 Tax=Armadillidium nasatum TaxID=96803 RepID=A0A5N5SRG2_9CRUS|nr:hypothetical protein Anas_14167 [Armadillidium nasatum]